MFIGLLQCNCTFTKWKGKLVHDMKEKVFAIILSLALILTMAPMRSLEILQGNCQVEESVYRTRYTKSRLTLRNENTLPTTSTSAHSRWDMCLR